MKLNEILTSIILAANRWGYDILWRGELMAATRVANEVSVLQMALIGYQVERQKIEAHINEIQSQLKGTRILHANGNSARTSGGTRRDLSAAARRRIALAQKKRWAAYRKAKAAKTQ